MAPQLYLRRANYDEVPRLHSVADAAFGHNDFSQAIFNSCTEEERQTHNGPWRIASMQRSFQKPGMHFVVVAERDPERPQDEEIAGYAMWQQPLTEVDPDAGKTDEQKQREREADQATWPACVNREVVNRFYGTVGEETEKALGKEEVRGMWAPQVLATHPKHQRKGVGAMLMRWGMEQAVKSGTDAYVVATAMGRMLYQKLGFEDVSEFWSSVDTAWVMRWRRPTTAVTEE